MFQEYLKKYFKNIFKKVEWIVSFAQKNCVFNFNFAARLTEHQLNILCRNFADSL